MADNPTAALVRRYFDEVVQLGQLEVIEELAHPDMVDEANQAFDGPPGRAGLVAHVKGFRRNVDDLELHLQRIVAEPTQAMAWWSFTGRHVGPWLGRTPTDGPLSATVFSFFDFQDGLISRYQLWLHAAFDEPAIFDTSRPGSSSPE